MFLSALGGGLLLPRDEVFQGSKLDALVVEGCGEDFTGVKGCAVLKNESAVHERVAVALAFACAFLGENFA